MQPLTDLPEIGPVTARQLQAVGIPDVEALRAVGAKEAFSRIQEELDPGACLMLLTALECGVRGVRSRDLAPEIKTDLRQWHREIGQ